MRNLLEQQILEDAKNGDTTVLAEILKNLGDMTVFHSLSDENQQKSGFRPIYKKLGDTLVLVGDLKDILNNMSNKDRLVLEDEDLYNLNVDAIHLGLDENQMDRGHEVRICKIENNDNPVSCTRYTILETQDNTQLLLNIHDEPLQTLMTFTKDSKRSHISKMANTMNCMMDMYSETQLNEFVDGDGFGQDTIIDFLANEMGYDTFDVIRIQTMFRKDMETNGW